MANPSDPALLDSLTPREREVLELLRRGLTDREIAEQLGVSTQGATFHVSAIIRKLGVRNRYEASTWPERPPWWMAAFAPILKPLSGAKWIAYAAGIMVFAVALVGLGLMAFLLVRNNSGKSEVEASGTVTIPYSVVTSLDNYAFESSLEISTDDGDLHAQFEGSFQAPDRYEGVLNGSGELYEFVGRPQITENIVSGEDVWWREPSGEWQTGIVFGEAGQEAIDPLLLFTTWATPRFYLEALRFDRLELPYAGSYGELHGVETLPPVTLSKPDLLRLLSENTFVKEEGKDPATVQEDAASFLPEDIIIKTWLSRTELYPVRVEITLNATLEDNSSFVFDKPMAIRLQMDITDPEAEVQIEPPIPIDPTSTPPPAVETPVATP